jgi:hypothetical protein
VAKLTMLAIALLFLLLIGLTHEPDSGTAASVGAPDVAEATVGSNHAKPLPRLMSVTALLVLWRVLVPVLAALAALVARQVGGRRLVPLERVDVRRPSLAWSVDRARRGPPALA